MNGGGIRRYAIPLVATLVLSAWSHAGEGKDAPGAAKPPAPASDLETVAVTSDQAPVKADGKVVATVEKGRMFGVLARRGDEVEVQICVGTQILRGTLALSHVKFLTDADIDLAAEWLKMSKDLNPKMDVAACRAKLDALIDRVAAAAVVGKAPREKARLIGVQLFEREGFSCADEFCADRLLDLKQGQCSSLSLLYLCIGNRLGVPIYLVLAPGHAFARYDDGRECFDIETTRGGKVHDTDDYLREHLGEGRIDLAGGIHLASLPTPRVVGVILQSWGISLAEMGHHAEACEKYAKAVEINRRLAEAYYNWGNALRRMGRLGKSCAKFANAVEINPRLADAYSNWGIALEEMGRQAEACEKFTKAVQIDQQNAEAHGNWGNALGEMGRYAEACEKFAKVVEIDPRDAVAFFNWGNALGEMGRHAEACEKFAKAVEIDPRLAKAFVNWGLAIGRMGKTAEAVEKLDKAIELDPSLKLPVDALRRKLLEGK